MPRVIPSDDVNTLPDLGSRRPPGFGRSNKYAVAGFLLSLLAPAVFLYGMVLNAAASFALRTIGGTIAIVAFAACLASVKRSHRRKRHMKPLALVGLTFAILECIIVLIIVVFIGWTTFFGHPAANAGPPTDVPPSGFQIVPQSNLPQE